jgi:hypothetical protein
LATPIGFDPTTINQTGVGNFRLGEVREFNGEEWIFVKIVDGSVVSGDVCELASATAFSATKSLAASTKGRKVLGVAKSSITVNQYGFLLKRGFHAAVKDAANGCTTGNYVMPHAATGGNAANITLGTNDATAFGFCVTSGSGGVCGVYVDC